MKISHEKPPIWEEANKLFKLEELKLGTIFTYGDTLHNPYKIPIAEDLMVHEETHAEQQGHDDTVAKLWWKRFIADPEFRLDQEAKAYGKQYKFLCSITKDRNKRARDLWNLATMLAGEMYGSVVSHSEAMKLIKKYAIL